MPVENRWYEFNSKQVLALPHDMLGIYFLADKSKVSVYIGSSEKSSIRSRLISHLRNNRCPKAKYFKYTLSRIFDNPKQMEAQAIFKHARKYKRLPIYIKAFPRLTELS